MIRIPIKGGGEYELSLVELRMLQGAYPRIDVAEQCQQMVAWCHANPRKQKTKRGVRRFINSWLARAQEKTPKQDMAYAASHKRFDTDQKKYVKNEAAGRAGIARLREAIKGKV